jgi:hypothetical protein
MSVPERPVGRLAYDSIAKSPELWRRPRPDDIQPHTAAGPDTRQVSMMDACSPSFNIFIGPGTCSRTGGMYFLDFIAELTAHQSAGAWHNAPSQTDVWLGDALLAVNKSGEIHPFTRVASFGGGIRHQLNAVAGTPIEVRNVKTSTPSFRQAVRTRNRSIRRASSSSSAVSIRGCVRPSS